jgi:hypothetical protein
MDTTDNNNIEVETLDCDCCPECGPDCCEDGCC